MADHLKPTLTSNYSSFVTELDGRFDDLAVGLDPAVTTATNVPTNSIRWSSAVNKWQKYNGTSWEDLTALYNISISGNAATVTNGVYTTGSYADPTWITSLAGPKISGDIAGNAGSATKLATARNINGIAFDGTTAISINLNNSVTFNNAGTGAASGSTFNGGSAVTVSYNTIGAPSIAGANATGTWSISITGNAGTVTNGVYTTGSYANPAWITSLAGSKISGAVSNASNIAIAADISSTGTFYVPYASATTGDVALRGTQLTIQPSTGNFSAVGNISANSDEKLKTDWSNLPDNFIELLASVKSGTYTRLDTGERQAGSSAQDWKKILPEVVNRNEETDILTLAYGNAALVSVVELAKEVLKLREEIEKLKAK